MKKKKTPRRPPGALSLFPSLLSATLLHTHLDLARFGQRRVQQGQQRLVRDVGAQGGRVAAVLAQKSGVVVAVEQDVGLWESGRGNEEAGWR